MGIKWVSNEPCFRVDGSPGSTTGTSGDSNSVRVRDVLLASNNPRDAAPDVFVMKTDDDVFVNLPALLRFLDASGRQSSEQRTIFGETSVSHSIDISRYHLFNFLEEYK
jgi:hypothetical protein